MRLAGLEPAGPISVVNSDLSTVTAEADLVFRVEEAEPYLVHLEVQSGHDRSMPRRLSQVSCPSLDTRASWNLLPTR